MKKVIIIGAGPAGITAAYELLKVQGYQPTIFEASESIGGISKTVNYKGYRMDIGGHRFFSKSDRVMQWWLNILPMEDVSTKGLDNFTITYQNQSRSVNTTNNGIDPEKEDKVMLVRSRLSRIFYGRNFYDYPIALNAETLKNLGPRRLIKIGYSYVLNKLFPVKEIKTLEDFFISRFGKELYNTFFKDYTEKVWGVKCNEIDAEWGAQRIKGLSVTKALTHALKKIVTKSKATSIAQKGTETSLIEYFLYPKFGPGQLWETVAEIVTKKGAELHLNHVATGVVTNGNKITAIKITNNKTGETKEIQGDYFFSTMPVKDLINSFDTVPVGIKNIANELQYRDFISVGLLLNKLKIKHKGSRNGVVPDNWIYIQEKDVKVGRLQVFNNWSPYLVKDPNKVWLGLEYFCFERDELWAMKDEDMIKFAAEELDKIGIINKEEVVDGVVVRMPKTYPAYFGAYKQFDEVRKFTDEFENLFLVGRNGMHKYNNQDHSMLTAMVAVENILNNVTSKDNIWAVNTEQEYHESK